MTPAAWPVATIGELLDGGGGEVRTGPFGSQLHRADYVIDSIGVPVVMPKDMSGGYVDYATIAMVTHEKAASLSQHITKSGDILLARRGEIGRCALIRESEQGLFCGTGCIRISTQDSALTPEFLHRFLLMPQTASRLEGMAVGSTMANLNAGIVRSLEVPVPPLSTQRRIASILSAYDDLVENNTRRIQILEEMAQAIYREWFVEFRFPGHEDVRMVDSALGPIPEGWQVEAFSEVGEFVNGYAFKPSDWGITGLPIVKIRELKDGVSAATPRHPINGLPDKYLIKSGDVLFSWSADLEAYTWPHGDAWLNQHLFKVEPRVDFSKYFLFHSLRAHMGEFRSRALGTTMRHIKRSALGQVKTVVPSRDLQARFDLLAAPIEALRLTLTAAGRNLRQTRDLLLPRLISGEIDVSELDLGDV